MASSYRADSRAHGAAALQGQTGFFPSARCSLVGSHTHCSRNQCEGGPVGGPGLVFTSGSAPEPMSPGSLGARKPPPSERVPGAARGPGTADCLTGHLQAQEPPWQAARGHSRAPSWHVVTWGLVHGQ